MAAFAVVILVYSLWFLVGFALIRTLYRSPNLLQGALLAPATGLAATELMVVWLNCAGLPVRYGGPLATLLLVSLSLFLLRRVSLRLPARRLLVFGAILSLSALVIGYPFVRFGFNWVSYCNDDMTNYCLGAKFFLNHGQFEAPDIRALVADRDASLFYWAFYVVGGIRHGADELLARLASCTGLSTAQVFMPTILSFHLVVISSTAALVLQGRAWRKAAVGVALMTGFSALVTLGTTYQLLGQVNGLGLLTAGCAVLLRPFTRNRRSEWPLAAIIIAALGMSYPEVTPFLALSCAGYHLLLCAARRESVRALGVGLGATCCAALLLLNVTVITTGLTVVSQAKAGTLTTPTPLILFPYYLTPAGFAYLWGFYGVNQPPTGLVLDAGIIAGLVLSLLAAIAAFWQAWRRQPVALVCLLMVLLAIKLFIAQSDFGLYKIAMYIQPFLLGTVVVAWTRIWRRARHLQMRQVVFWAPLVLVTGWGLIGQI